MRSAPLIVTLLSAVAATLVIALTIQDAIQELARNRADTQRAANVSMPELFLLVDPGLLYVAVALCVLVVTLCIWLFAGSSAVAAVCGASSVALPAAASRAWLKRRRTKDASRGALH